MPTTTLTHGTIYYTSTKSNTVLYPPLVLVHGAGGSHLDWPPTLRRLPKAHIISVDLPGHGQSSGEGYADTYNYARDMVALLDALEIAHAIIVGHSMGGAIAQQIGIHWSKRAAGLILLGTGSKLPVDLTLPQRIVKEPVATADWITAWAWSDNAPVDLKHLGRERLLAVPPDVLQRDYLACQAFDVREKLEQITAPTLVLAASADRMVKPQFSITLSERIPNATLVTIDDAGHMFPLEQPKAVVSAIQYWLMEQVW